MKYLYPVIVGKGTVWPLPFLHMFPAGQRAASGNRSVHRYHFYPSIVLRSVPGDATGTG